VCFTILVLPVLLDEEYWSFQYRMFYWYIQYRIYTILDFRYYNITILVFLVMYNITILVLPVLRPAAPYYPGDLHKGPSIDASYQISVHLGFRGED
jgi:hypothetical protein